MPIFTYKALNNNGEIIHGHLVAATKNFALQELSKKELRLIKIQAKIPNLFFKKNYRWVTQWSKDISFFLDKRLSLVESLETSKISLNKQRQHLIDEIISEIHLGHTLSSALKNSGEIPDLLISFLTVGEASGAYAQAFLNYALICEERDNFSKGLWSSLPYPLALGLVMLMVIMGFSEFLLPSLTDFFKQNDFAPSETTLMFIKFSKLISESVKFITEPIVIILFLIIIVFCTFNPTLKAINSNLVLKIPFFGKIYLQMLQTLYLQTFSKLLSQGHFVNQAAFYSADILPNAYLKKNGMQIITAIEKDGSTADSITQYLLLIPTYSTLLKKGEKTSSLAFYSNLCAENIKKHYQSSMKNILTWTVPILVTTIGLVTIFMVVAVVLPLYEQMSKIG